MIRYTLLLLCESKGDVIDTRYQVQICVQTDTVEMEERIVSKGVFSLSLSVFIAPDVEPGSLLIPINVNVQIWKKK